MKRPFFTLIALIFLVACEPFWRESNLKDDILAPSTPKTIAKENATTSQKKKTYDGIERCDRLSPMGDFPETTQHTTGLTFTGEDTFEGEFDIRERISNGSPTKINDPGAASVVSIRIELASGELAACTGSRISEEWILTAAHCFFHPKNENISAKTVKVFNNSLTKFGGKSISGTPYCHKDYGFRGQYYENDLALIKLDEKVQGAKMPLVRSQDQSIKSTPERETITIMGYGYLTPEEKSRELMSGQVQSAPANRKCTAAQADNKTLCTVTIGIDGVKPSSLCVGDSGGPAMARLSDGVSRQIGVNSFISNVQEGRKATCGRRGNYSAFVDLQHYESWIMGVIE